MKKDKSWFPTGRHPMPTVDVIIETSGGLVLVRRKHPPHGWSLPGGFIDSGESPEQAAAREAREETGLEIGQPRQFRAYGAPERDPRFHTITIVYSARARGTPRGADDAAEARVFPWDNLPGELAFDHRRIIDDYRRDRRPGQAGRTPPGPAPGEPAGPVISEPARDIPVRGDFDVVVAGAGIAGVAAAVAAARAGASACILERTFAPGGLATLGNVTAWLPLCDGRGRQVMAGLPEELLLLSVADLGANNKAARFTGVPACWRSGGDPAGRAQSRYRVDFNPAAYLLALEKLLSESGVTILYDTRACAVRRHRDRVSHLLVENRDGRSAISGRAFVDATGDADISFLAGERTESLDSNVLCGWFYYLDGRGLKLVKLSNAYNRHALREESTGPFFRGDEAGQVTAFMLGSRVLLRRKLDALRAERPGEDVQPVMPPVIPCFRMTRRLVGTFSLGERHVHRWFPDTIGLTGDWRRAGPVYAIPRRALAGVANRNLLAAGRCISADRTAWDVTRAIPPCALTGAAAGIIAAMAAGETGGDVRAPGNAAVRKRLAASGFLLDRGLAVPAGGERHEERGGAGPA